MDLENPANAKMLEAAHLLPVYAQLDIEPIEAHGVTIRCRDRTLVDFYGGHAVTALGYGHPRILETLARQAQKLQFQSNAVALEIRAHAARRLAGFAPPGLSHVFFVNSGAEANENALRIALRASGRSRVVALEHGFHGRTAAAGAVTWGARERWYGFPRTPFDVRFAPRDDAEAACAMLDADTAALILEPVQGVAGAFDLAPDFVQALAKRCRDLGIALIADEVQTGVGRSGAGFAADVYDLKPDLLTVAKGLGGGFPCGAVLCTGALAAGLGPGALGSTFGGGPLACAMIATVIDVIEEEGLLANVREREREIRERCVTGPVTAVQGLGLLLGLRCTRPAREVRDALLERGILAGTSADPHILRLLPPLILESRHVTQLADALTDIPA